MTRHSNTRKIQAAVLRSPDRPLEIETLRIEGPRDDEILVRIEATGVCRTDIDICDEWDEVDGPVVLGHEGAGVVEEVGRRVKDVKPGDHVVLSYQSCGRCRPCREGRPTDCRRFYELNFGFMRLDGSNALEKSGVRGHFFGQSSFATYSLVTERNLVKVPEDLPLELLAPLGCGFQTGAGAIMNSLRVQEGSSVAVFGTGAVGLAAVMAARIVGADPIIGVDINPMRLKLAEELGATHTIDNRHEGIAPGVAAITAGGVEYVLEITGNPNMLSTAVQTLNPGGTVALFTGERAPSGLPRGRKALSIIQGDAIPQRFIPTLVQLFREGRFPFDRLIRFYDFWDINKAMADARSGDTVKPVLRFGGGTS